ncbi:MAG: hypothetical protein AMK73_03395 [Planctomycetes bacterium SM23_32]|nr:MAG: hypothetical protein AMK73_03395 [Planctomycetes bacterium SM23_32]
MLEFRPLTLGDRPKVMAALRQSPPRISEHTFTNLYVWRYRRPVRMAEVGKGVLDEVLDMVDRWFAEREMDQSEGLRRAKESYHPHHMVEKYVVRWDGNQA